MAIEKKSLISTLQSTKKANVVSSAPSHEAAKFAPKKPMHGATKKSLKSATKLSVKASTKLVAKKMEA